MKLYPNDNFKKVEEITIEYLKENKINGLILDVDNTLVDYTKKMKEPVEKWLRNIANSGILVYILSNTSDEKKIIEITKKVDIKYIYFAKKPFKKGFLKIQKEFGIKPENIAVVGDQIFTDIIGGNRCKMFTILVDPIERKEFWYTAWKRPIEENIMKKYFKLKSKEKENK